LSEPSVGRAAAVAFPIIVIVVSILFGISYLISTLLGFPFSLGLPIAVRAVGGVMVVAGLLLMGWVFRRRSPAKVIVSTYITFTKLFGRAPVAERAGRTEPLVVDGPQKYVRNPLYFGVIVMVLGWGLLTGYSFVLVATVVLLLWFGLFLIPFEERELQALFGEEWTKYSEQTPMLIPFTKRRKKRGVTAS
jgi:protein-S-isoprenylcysteine O-methyltransferase Ste14